MARQRRQARQQRPSLLGRPEAKALLKDARVTAAAVRGCLEHLTEYLQRYLPLFYREEQRQLAEVVVRGRLSGLERKTSEPIATQAQRPRKPVQHFVGAGKWDDDAVMAELRGQVAEALGAADSSVIFDGSGFAKKGTASCGVARQWCGRLGKIENCQVGVFAALAGVAGHGPLDRRLYLPAEWARDRQRRRQCHVPKDVVFQEKWRLALAMLEQWGADVPHGWVSADDEFGRVSDFRAQLRARHERYVLDVPSNTLVREVVVGVGDTSCKPPWESVAAWALRQPASRWQKLRVRAGEKGEIVVRALTALVQTKDEDGAVGPLERVLVIRTVDQEAQTWYALSNARHTETLATLVGVKMDRHQVEQVLQEGKGEVGLGHYEVRSWVGWHHHMTLALLSLWFLNLERCRLGKKNPGPDCAAVAANR